MKSDPMSRPTLRLQSLRRLLLLFSLYDSSCSCQQALALSGPPCVTTVAGEGYFAVVANERAAPWFVSQSEYPGVLRAARNLQSDITSVAGVTPQLITNERPVSGAVVIVGVVGSSTLIDDLIERGKFNPVGLAGRWETFVLEVIDDPLPGVDQALVIAGSDKRGAIFGMYELAAQIGVSPWHWWADVPIEPKASLYVRPGRHSSGAPAVKYRGIFINDEAPALAGWAQEKFGGCNHKFYEHVFELILRLKGNYLWPAMWGRSIYDDDPESARLADECGIVIGMSHHEPMMRAHVEWERYGDGSWNYQTNEAKLRDFWRQGIERMGSHESVVAVGMRGDGDEPMSDEANVALLERIIADQRQILADVTGKHASQVPQMWALYKEVQEYYDRGMRVPDDVTLLLCDDNWGNIRKLPKLDEPARSGGYGVYYHFDYVGGPRNYKWLNTNPIPRVWEQMHLAWQYGADRLWIVNVGDIKPMEYPIEFFLDYAWSPDSWPAERLPEYARRWTAAQLGEKHAAEIAEVLTKYTKYNGRRKPELLSPDTYSLDNFNEAERVAKEWSDLEAQVARIRAELGAEYHDAYFQLVEHPVAACANLNALYLAAARNRLYATQGRIAANDEADLVKQLFERDAELSRQYNEDIAGGKWTHMMDQTHIGYTSWQEPRRNVMPKVTNIAVPDGAEMGVALEGSDHWWPQSNDAPRLPALSPWSPIPTRTFEVFSRGREPFECEVSCDAPWVSLPAGKHEIKTQRRFAVSIDWAKADVGEHHAEIVVTGPNNSKVSIRITADKPRPELEGEISGFVEADGYVAIEAEHYTQAIDKAPIRWVRVPDLGRNLSGIMPVPVTAPRQRPGDGSSHLEYKVYLFQSGEVDVSAFVSPSIDFTASGGLEYGVSIDDEKPQLVNINAEESTAVWERNVAANINVSTTKHMIDKPGEHTLKFWMVDAGVVLQRLVLETDGAAPSYLGPPESVYRVRPGRE
jgi:hypothetical protein